MNKLWVRLTAAILLVTWIVLAIVAVVVYRSVETSFRQYVGVRNFATFDAGLIDELQNYYVANGGWRGAESLLPAMMMGRGMGERHGRGGMQSFIADPNGVIVATTDAAALGQTIDEIGAAQTTPLTVNGATVGLLGQQTPATQALVRSEQTFTDQVTQALIAIAIVATLVAFALGILLAYWLARPIQRLAERIHAVAAPQLGQPIAVEGPSEVRQLAASFNKLSQRLAEGEQLRRQMTSDVAHELRTPVSVLRGHLEAMMDGVYPLDAEHLTVAYDQTLHLARLVEDMRLLTQAESGRLPLQLADVAPALLVAEAAERFAPLAQDAGIRLESRAEPDLPAIRVDDGRMRQVFDNLLTNALRHTPPAGHIAITAAPAPNGEQRVRFCVSNSGHLPPDQIQHLFDRFWRGDAARQADGGGSGLGLAITRQLVVLHQGTIHAESEGDTTDFIVELPCNLSVDSASNQ